MTAKEKLLHEIEVMSEERAFQLLRQIEEDRLDYQEGISRLHDPDDLTVSADEAKLFLRRNRK